MPTTNLLPTDLTLASNCDKIVSKNLGLDGKKWVAEAPAGQKLGFPALHPPSFHPKQSTRLSGLQTP
jgi:hypothetical protein